MRRLTLATLVLLVACTGDGPPPPGLGGAIGPTDDGEPTLHPDVVLVEETDCFVSVEITEPDRSVLTFELSCAPEEIGLVPGALVVGVVDGGYLRRVEGVSVLGDTATVTTSGASMAEAVANVEMHEVFSATDGERFSIDLSNITLWGEEIGPSPVYIRTESGSVVVDPELTMDADFSWFSLDRATMRVDTTYSLDVLLYGRSTNGLHLHKDTTLGSFNRPFAFALGPLPVVGVWENTVKLGFWAQAPGGFETTFGGIAGGVATVGGTYDTDDGWETVNEATFEASAHPVDFDLRTDLTLRPYVRVESFLKFYGLAGPAFRADGYVEGDFRAGCPGVDWDVTAAIETKALLRLQLTDRFKPTKVIPVKTWEWPLLDGFWPWPFEVPAELCGQTDLECGATVEYDTAWPGASDWNSAYPGCAGGSFAGPEMVHRLTVPAGEHVEVTAEIDSTGADHRVFLLDGAGYPGGGPFSEDACIEGGGSSATADAWGGEVWWVAVDSASTDPAPYRLSLTCEEIVDPDPDPDDPDAGPPGTCEAVGTIACGDEVVGDTTGGVDAMSYYPCNVGNYTGPEEVWEWTATVTGPVEWKLVRPRPTQLDQDVIVLDGSGGCVSEKCEAWGGNGTEFDAVAGVTYMLVVDGYNGAEGAYTATLDCSP